MSGTEDRLAGVLVGTALGDALGLPFENLTAEVIAADFPARGRFHFLGRAGHVSDDTEQSALVAQSLLREPADAEACAGRFGRALVGWLLRVPWGIGFATLRACAWRMVGFRASGVRSAGNGAAMRAAVAGVFFATDPARRRAFSDALARITHTDPRAVEAARFVAALAADLSLRQPGQSVEVAAARAEVADATLAAALDRAIALAGAPVAEQARELGTTGYAVHTVAFALAVFLRYGDRPAEALEEAVRAGGDTDSIGAIVGAWCGARHGLSGLPPALVADLAPGPFGPAHLIALAHALACRQRGEPAPCPEFSAAAALARNLTLLPVVLAHVAARAARSLRRR